MSTPEASDSRRVLYLQEINITLAEKIKIEVALRNDTTNTPTMLHKDKDTAIWKPSTSLELQDTSNYILTITGGRKRDFLRRPVEQVEVAGNRLMQKFWDGENSLNVEITFHNHPLTVTLLFYPSTASNNARIAVQNLQEAMEAYKPLMKEPVQHWIGHAVAVGQVVGELNPIAKAVFAVAKKTFELLKEQQKYDAMVPDLAKRIEEILPFADRIGDSIDRANMDLLVEALKQLYRLVEETACFIRDYVKRSAGHRTLGALGSPEDQTRIKGFTDKFTAMKEVFDRALNVEMFKMTREALEKARDSENRTILERIKPMTSAPYDEARKCLEGTRNSVLEHIVDDFMKMAPSNGPSKNLYWLHGTPGLGKTAIATSLCASLHANGQLGGSFFCNRKLSDSHESKHVLPASIYQPDVMLPALIYQLAGMWAPYRKLVAQALNDDPQLGPGTPSQLLSKLLLGPLNSMQDRPPLPLAIVIDALDEWGNDSTRRKLLDDLFEVTASAPWLKLIITSRPEQDIQSFFKVISRSHHVACDLAQVNADDDIRFFLRHHLPFIPGDCGLPDWPSKEKVDKVTLRSGGLFMFVDTVCRFVKGKVDPKKALEQIIGEKSETASEGLDGLYQRAIELVVDKEDLAVFRSVVGAILAIASHRPLGDNTLTALLKHEPYKHEPYVVVGIVNKLGSLLDREEDGGGIRVRHLSITEFLTQRTTHPDFRIDLNTTNAELGTSCLLVMLKDLRFNICQLETSSQLNSQVKDLESRITQYLPDALQYSCVHWSNHVCSGGDPSNNIKSLLVQFLAGEKVLYWLEVLSLLGKVPTALASLQQLKVWLKSPQGPCLQLTVDILRFVTAFYTPISASCPHIYLSALPFSPKKSLLWDNVRNSFQNLLDVHKGRLETWQAFPHVWQGHTKPIEAVAYSADGLRVISASNDETIRIWDTETGQQVGEPLTGHAYSVLSVAYSPDGSQIVSGSGDNTVRIWKAKNGQQVGKPLTGHGDAVYSVAYSPDGCQIISGSEDKTIRIWVAKTGEQVGEPLTGHTHPVYSVAYSPDGYQIVSGSGDKTIRIWNVKTKQQKGEPLIGHTSRVYSVSYSPDGLQIVSGSRDNTIRVWDTQTRQQVGKSLVGHTDPVSSVAYSPNGHQIVSGSYDRTIRIWSAENGQQLGKPLTGHTDTVYIVAYSPDGCQIISGSWDNIIRIWDAKTGQKVGEQLTRHTDLVSSVTYSPTKSQFVSSSDDKTICIWDANIGQQVGQTLTGHTNLVCSVAYSPDGDQLVSGSGDTTIRIWDIKTGKQVGKPLIGHTKSVNSVVYSPDGHEIVSGSGDNTICIWDAKTKQQVGEPLVGHTDSVNSIAYSPDGCQIVSGSADNTICIWDAKTKQQVGEPLIGHTYSVNSIAYSPDRHEIASGSDDGTIRIWNAETGQQLGEPLIGHTYPVNSVAYSPDGCQIVSCSRDKTIQMWDVKTRKQVEAPLTGHTDSVSDIAYSLDGNQIVSGSSDKTIRIWDPKKLPSNYLDVKPNLKLDQSGWVCQGEELVFWLPEDYRNGFLCPALITIPSTGKYRQVQVDINQMSYGTFWTEVWNVHK